MTDDRVEPLDDFEYEPIRRALFDIPPGQGAGAARQRIAQNLHDAGMRITGHLDPAENMALTVALAQIRRGDEVPPNTTAVLVYALERLARG